MRLLLLFLLVISWSSTFSQSTVKKTESNNDPVKEHIFVQTNSNSFITGETLFFKIFCQQAKNNKPTFLSKIAYVEIVDESGAAVLKTKVFLENGKGHGDFFIPSTLSSGNYILIAYTQWMRNFSTDSFFKNQLTIINPFRKPTVITLRSNKKSDEQTAPPISSQQRSIQLKLTGNKYKTREKVSITLSADILSTANVTVSVRKKEAALDDAGTILKQLNTEIPEDSTYSESPFSKNLQESDRADTYLPEIRGHLITGTLTPKASGTSSAKKNILASIPGTDFVFQASSTDQHGNFSMIIDHMAEASTLIFQLLDGDINAFTLKVNDPFLSDLSKFKPAPLTISTDLDKIVDERNIFTQIENAYYAAKKDSSTVTPHSSFYNVPDKTYKLDDFTRFPTMEDVFREYIPEVVVKRRGNIFSLQVVSPRFGAPPPKEPLMLIDGVPILNTNVFMEYSPLKVERIEIVKKKYFYGSLDIDGIISMKTYKGSLDDLPSVSSHRENLIKIQSDKIYFFPDYTSDKLKLERVPDYRLQLYWNPTVVLTKGANTTIDFYTSDVTGDFEITVEGFSSDGTLLSRSEIITVSK